MTVAESGASSGGAEAGGAGGAAVDLCVGLDLSCANDNNPCTEDECNPATGECGIPRTGTACDDGLYCSGADTCDNGECTEHEGNPCGDNTCNEAEDFCECDMDDDCPADAPGEWGACMFGVTICNESGTRSRPVATSTCTAGKCVAGATVENEACTRDTDGIACTDDGLRCTGAEKCVAGQCMGAGNPCGGATPYCYSGGTQCRECLGNDGCGGAEKCCSGTCIPTANVCGIIGTIIGPTISPTVIGPTIIGTIAPL
jgi:hypothetical protein